MKITGHHMTPAGDLQRSEVLSDGNTYRRISRPYSVDTATGDVELCPPYAEAQWQIRDDVVYGRDVGWVGEPWTDVQSETCRQELERQFVEELIRVNLSDATTLKTLLPL